MFIPVPLFDVLMSVVLLLHHIPVVPVHTIYAA